MAETNKKLFLGIGIDFDSLDGMSEMMKKLKIFSDKREYPIKWVPPDNFHITLQYLDFLNEEEQEKIENKVSRLIKKTPSFQIDIRNTGAFPSVEKGRMMWLGVRESRDLMEFQNKLEDICLEALPDKSFERPPNYTPHISIGRLRSTKHLGSLLQPYLRKQFGKKDVTEIVLFESILQNRFPVYKKLKTWQLK